ncbi:MAG TPA: prepilin-type N-terminal cleavage/methylation domain-containing protein [Vicinamibacterales bacterium]|nr:prepilin-type N-terminal cleavage/methylation domain-containing protein [Vicinamibacterales bacterium]
MRARSSTGFTLLEVVVALAILCGVLITLPQVLLQAAAAASAARRTTMASVVAAEKLEQLRGLAWGYDAAGARVEDTQSDVARTPVAETGGMGLGLSPGGSLDADTPGFVDYLDAEGGWLGSGPAPPGTVFVRRWSVAPLADGPSDTLVLAVRVVLPAQGGSGGGAGIEAASLRTLKTRRPQ